MKRILYSSILFLLSSCVSTSMKSVKSPSFEGKLDRVFLIMRGPGIAVKYFEKFDELLSAQLTGKGVANESYVEKPLELIGENEVQQRIKDFSPNFLMVIQQKELTEINSAIKAGFDIKIFHHGNDKPIWRAFLEMQDNTITRSTMTMNAGASESVNRLMHKLADDGLL